MMTILKSASRNFPTNKCFSGPNPTLKTRPITSQLLFLKNSKIYVIKHRHRCDFNVPWVSSTSQNYPVLLIRTSPSGRSKRCWHLDGAIKIIKKPVRLGIQPIGKGVTNSLRFINPGFLFPNSIIFYSLRSFRKISSVARREDFFCSWVRL